ncbi:hypothetical protein AAW14_06255 [Streptomyces hygroscopicus]|uniref:hypothetical protein n=1 Tax=Streptomyces hygroscopicus TaxID=1912 RepID=UPI00224027E8|nr:hypothetical protein [Streptomyces hygroscopicus]MCW7941643.1 hypothetical protein [Streptomyces hygroscopicus]
MVKKVRVQPHIQDSVLRDPFEPTTHFPNELIQNADVSLSALGLLLELLATDGDFDVDAARTAELERRAAGIPPEDVDELLRELEAAGYVTVTEE